MESTKVYSLAVGWGERSRNDLAGGSYIDRNDFAGTVKNVPTVTDYKRNISLLASFEHRRDAAISVVVLLN